MGDNMTKLKKVTMQIVTVTLVLLTTPAKKMLHGPTSFASKRLVFTEVIQKKLWYFLDIICVS